MAKDNVVPFVAAEPPPFRDLGLTPLARQLGLVSRSVSGHWCRDCRGIWFGWVLEAQCPACGRRG